MINTPIMILVSDESKNTDKLIEDILNTEIENSQIIIVDNRTDKTNKITNKKISIISPVEHLKKKYAILFCMNAAFKIASYSFECIIFTEQEKLEKYWLNDILKDLNGIKISECEKYCAVDRKLYLNLKKHGYFSYADINGIGNLLGVIKKIGERIN